MTEERPRWLDYMPVDELAERFDERNPKGHSLDELRDAYGRFGYTEPVLLDERTGKLVAGHGRVELLVAEWQLGNAAPEGVLAQQEEGGVRWYVPVTRGWSSTDDAEAAAYLIASNRLTERGGWRADPLAALLDELSKVDGGLVGVGYSPTEVDDLLATIAPPPSLDELARRHGESKAEDFWPTVKFTVPPELRARYEKLLDGVEGDDVARFTYLLDLAEWGRSEAAAR